MLRASSATKPFEIIALLLRQLEGTTAAIGPGALHGAMKSRANSEREFIGLTNSPAPVVCRDRPKCLAGGSAARRGVGSSGFSREVEGWARKAAKTAKGDWAKASIVVDPSLDGGQERCLTGTDPNRESSRAKCGGPHRLDHRRPILWMN